MTTDPNPTQRMAEIEAQLSQGDARNPPVEIRWLLNRCRKLEKVAEAADALLRRSSEKDERPLAYALVAAGYGPNVP